MRMLKIFSIYIIVVALFISQISVTFAQKKDSTASSGVMQVEQVANLRDRIWERITLFFKFSNNDKVGYEKYLVQKRFAELKYVIDDGQGNMIEETSSRYSTYLGRLTDRIVRNKMVDKKEEVLKIFESQLPVLEELLSRQEYNSGFWLLLQHDVNYLKLYIDQIKNVN